jgi:hypothetical protein
VPNLDNEGFELYLKQYFSQGFWNDFSDGNNLAAPPLQADETHNLIFSLPSTASALCVPFEN